MKLGFSLLSICLLALTLPGCGDRNCEQESLVKMAVELKKNSARIKELSLALDGVNARLAKIQDTLEEFSSRSSPTEGASSPLAGAPGSGSTDMENLSRQVAVLMEELAATNEELASAKGAMEKIVAKASEPKDIGGALFKVAGDPQNFAGGVDKLVQRVSPRIEDAATRQNFEAEMAQLQDLVLTPSSPEELYQELHTRHLEKLNAVTNENDRRAVEEAIRQLENCGEQELQKRLAQYARERTLGEFFRIVKNPTYGVQREDLVETWFANPGQK
jgi:chromosome segregation ATPase